MIAENGMQAVKLFQDRLNSHCPNKDCIVYKCRLIFMDIQMPILNGILATK